VDLPLEESLGFETRPGAVDVVIDTEHRRPAPPPCRGPVGMSRALGTNNERMRSQSRF
jgi:hypothetical protein